MLRARPDLTELFGPSVRTAWLAAAAVALQFTLAAALAQAPFGLVVLLGFVVGGFAGHCLNAVIHECAHNLVFRRPAANKAFAIVANLPSLVPAAVGFRHFHLLHHRHFGRRGFDADLATPWEIRVVGYTLWRKLAWLLAMPFSYTIVRPLWVKERLPIDGWLIANVAAVGVAWFAVVEIGGWAWVYLLVSSYCSIGPHPAAAHLLQEHIMFGDGKETASYYGPLNLVSVNVGFHLEHHDFSNIAGWRLPRLYRMMPEFYAGLPAHRSRVAGLWTFLTDPAIGLDTRWIVEDAAAEA